MWKGWNMICCCGQHRWHQWHQVSQSTHQMFCCCNKLHQVSQRTRDLCSLSWFIRRDKWHVICDLQYGNIRYHKLQNEKCNWWFSLSQTTSGETHIMCYLAMWFGPHQAFSEACSHFFSPESVLSCVPSLIVWYTHFLSCPRHMTIRCCILLLPERFGMHVSSSGVIMFVSSGVTMIGLLWLLRSAPTGLCNVQSTFIFGLCISPFIQWQTSCFPDLREDFRCCSLVLCCDDFHFQSSVLLLARDFFICAEGASSINFGWPLSMVMIGGSFASFPLLTVRGFIVSDTDDHVSPCAWWLVCAFVGDAATSVCDAGLKLCDLA